MEKRPKLGIFKNAKFFFLFSKTHNLRVSCHGVNEPLQSGTPCIVINILLSVFMLSLSAECDGASHLKNVKVQ
jgi:hypothetical protein